MSQLRLSERGIPEGKTISSPPHGTPRRLPILLLSAWVMGWFLTTPAKANAQGVCDRTPQVRNKLVESAGVSSCEDVTPEHLAAVTLLDLSESGISALQAHDFRDLGHLRSLRLYGNSLTILPASVFQGLSRLEQLALNANRLSQLPPELFRDLGSLERLWLYGNRLETLPNGIFSGLPELTYLSLAENSLTVVPVGAFTGLSKLESLSLLRNSLSTLPGGIFRDMGSLSQLWLQENALTNLPEGVFGGLVSLRTLRLDRNLLTELPQAAFRGLTQLRSLSLDHNLLNALGGRSFLGLNLLQRLTLDSNSMRELPGEIFTGLSSLVELQLRQNRLRTLPAGIFKDLRILQILTLDENSLRELPNGVFTGLSRLVQLLLHGNHLRSLPEEVFGGLSGLKRLTLNRNSLRKLPAGVFRGLRRLRDLALEENQLNALPEGVFDHNLATLGAVQDSPGLRVDTAVKAQPAFLFSDGVAAPGTAATATVTLHRPLPVAVRLPYSLGGTATAADYADLSPNPEEGVLFPAGETQRQISLNILAGGDRLGKTLVITLGELSRFRLRRSDGKGPDAPYLAAETLLSRTPEAATHTLTFANTDPGSTTGGICDRTPQVRAELLEVTGESACGQITAGQLAAVTLLDLRRAGIHALQAQDFAGLTALTRLNLQDNLLATLPEDVFSGLSSLTWLDLRSNALTALPDGIFSGLGNLETLWLNGNSLTELPEAVFQDLSRLADLDLGFNSITSLPEGVFDGLSELRALRLHRNSLMELPGRLLPEMSDPGELIPVGQPPLAANLEALWLHGNRLNELPEDAFQGLGNLRALLLDGNSLTVVPEGVFRELRRLQVLRLGDNSIVFLPEGVFRRLSSLEQLELDHNRLTGLPETIFSGLSHLEWLNLSQNLLADLPPGIFQGLTRLEELRLDGNRLVDLPPGLLDDTLSELGIGPENQGLHADAALKARLGFAPAAQTAGPGTRVTVPVTLHRALPLALRVPYTVSDTASSAEYAELSPSPEEGLLFAAGETRKEITLSLLGGAGNAGKTIMLSLGQTSEIDLFRSDGKGSKAPFLKAVTLLSIPADGATHTLTVSHLDPGSTTGGICDRTPQVRDKLLETTGVSACGQFTPGQLASVTRLDLRQIEIHALRAQDFNGLRSLKRLSLGENRLTSLPEDVFRGLSGLTWLDLSLNALTTLPKGVFGGLGSLETLWLNGNSLTEVPEAVFEHLNHLIDLNLGSNSLTALPEGVFDGLSALQALKLHENSLIELPVGLFLKLSDTEPSTSVDAPPQPARLESLWLQGNRLRALPQDLFLGLSNLRTLLLHRNSLIALPEGLFGGLSHLQTLRLDHNSLASLLPGIFRGLSSLEELRLDGNRLEALPPGLFDDALATLGIGSRNQGLHVDPTLKARLGFDPTAQTATPGTTVTASVSLHRAIPVSLRVPFAVGGTASSTDYADLSPSPEEGLLFLAGETRKEITLNLLESAGAGKTLLFTLGDLSEIRLGPSDGTGPDAPFLKPETLVSGSPAPETHTVTVIGPGGGLNRSFVPVILSAAGRRGSNFTSEMTLTNRGAAPAALTYTYTAHRGGGSGTATDLLAAGRQKIVPDAIQYLRGLGLPIPAGGNPIGTLAVEYAGDSTVGVSVRTTTPVPRGRAGVAYPAVSMGNGFQDPVYLAGLRQTARDRSNLALQNMGLAADGPVRLRVTVFSGDAADSNPTLLDEVTLKPGGFRQFDGVLGSLANGYARVERTAGTAPFYAYGVINDQANSDGSFVHAVTAGSLEDITGQTLPVVLERGPFTSELTVTNFSQRDQTVSFALVSEGVNTADLTAGFSMRLEAGEQVITPNLVEEMRRQGVSGIGPAAGLAGALFARVEGEDMSGIVIGARTVSPALLAGGQYGVFYNAVPYGSAFSRVAWVEGLQQNRESRSNLALVNTGEVDDSESVFSIDIYDGETGLLVRTLTGRTVPARGWQQIDSILRDYATGTTQGYVRIRKISGNNPFLAYGVINDGGSPGERSGDGAYLAARE